ncbi:MAG: HAD-IA family hydrolase [Verrucomicrobiae bacterium]|nr:HAD-IA family hydrolase [Verrucomicrobiae bacterium]
MDGTGKIQAVTFDVGGTLIEPWPSVGHVYAEVAARYGAKGLSAEMLNRRFLAAWKQHPAFDHTVADWAAIVDESFAGLLTEKPSQTFFPELYEHFGSATAWRVYADVRPTLEALRTRSLRLGLISNWDDRLRPLLRALDLTEYFEAILISCEVGAGKPAPAIFQEAVRRMGVPAGAILHVGDSMEADVQGARAAGLSAVQIERVAEPKQNCQIQSLTELLLRV